MTAGSSNSGIQISATVCDDQRVDLQTKDDDQYQSRKPKWWTQLAGRRGTKAQRQAIQQTTERGYCISKEILTDFSRINNRFKQTYSGNSNEVETSSIDRWKRRWWNRALAIKDSPDIHVECTFDVSIILNDQNKKYTEKFQEMIHFNNPLTPREYTQKWLEIGFGNGSNMFANARNNPNNLYLGSEIHQPGVGTLAQKIEEGLKSESGSIVENVRVLPGDGIKLLYHLPNDYLDAILVTFPDPWPKEFHAKWRVIQTETIREMKRVLKMNGCVFVATDAVCFNDWARQIFAKEGTDEWTPVIPCPSRDGWLPIVSYYEQKGINEGRHTMLQCWQSKNPHE